MNTTNHTDVHPIEFFIACLFNLADAILWTINEVLGHHVTPTSSHQPQTTPAFTVHVTKDHTTDLVTHPTETIEDAWDAYIRTLSVKQLRVHTGIKNKKILKAQLIAIATNTTGEYVASYA